MSDNDVRRLKFEEAREQYFGKFDQFLDTSTEGHFWLRDDRIAGHVADAIIYRDRKVYDLLAYCIMPNHVHMVFSVERFAESLPARDGVSRYIVTDIIGSLKKFTAHEANKILHRSGIFWQHESYDHVVRNDRDLGRIIEYVLNNPVKAGMVQDWTKWKWSYCKFIP
ncbi:MAG: transposase [Bacteroidota bacterium]